MNVSPIRVPPPATPPSPSSPTVRPGSTPPVGGESQAAAPPGATLWELLTPAERAFFAEQKALGAATYSSSAMKPSGAPAPLGQRIDVRG